MPFEPAPFIVGCVAALGGLAIMARGVLNLIKIKASASWIETTARITKIEMKEWLGHKGSRTYSLALAYEYEVDGDQHHGSRPSYFPVNTKASIEAFMARHEQTTSAWYNPERPEEAVLERTGSKPLHALFMGLIVAATGGILIVVATT